MSRREVRAQVGEVLERLSDGIALRGGVAAQLVVVAVDLVVAGGDGERAEDDQQEDCTDDGRERD